MTLQKLCQAVLCSDIITRKIKTEEKQALSAMYVSIVLSVVFNFMLSTLRPHHLKEELLQLVCEHPHCSNDILETLLSEETECLNLKGYNGEIHELSQIIAKRCCNLVELSMCGVQSNYSDIFTVFKQLKFLETLDMSYVDEMNDAHVEYLLNHATKMTSITLNWCHNISDRTIDYITLLCPAIIHLGLTGTSVTTIGVMKLNRCKYLQSLTLQGKLMLAMQI